MANKRVVYTCVIGDFDRVFPPLVQEPGLDYVLLTDLEGVSVRGWTTRRIDRLSGDNTRQSNRFYKLFPHRLFPDHDTSLYIDGNIRPIGPVSELFDQLDASGDEMLVARHPLRTRADEEIAACLENRRIKDPALAEAEYARMQAEGFEETGELSENNVLLRDHRGPNLDAAMEMWWEFITSYGGRDQVAFPHVVQKTGLRRGFLELKVRDQNRYFQFYPHAGQQSGRLTWARHIYIYLKARQTESIVFRVAQRLLRPLLYY